MHLKTMVYYTMGVSSIQFPQSYLLNDIHRRSYDEKNLWGCCNCFQINGKQSNFILSKFVKEAFYHFFLSTVSFKWTKPFSTCLVFELFAHGSLPLTQCVCIIRQCVSTPNNCYLLPYNSFCKHSSPNRHNPPIICLLIQY